MSVKFLEQLNRNVVRFPLSGKISAPGVASILQNAEISNHNTPNYDNTLAQNENGTGISPTMLFTSMTPII